jgi:hypothetical protein
MKNASCHNENMEAYCNVVRALEDKFYGIVTAQNVITCLALHHEYGCLL